MFEKAQELSSQLFQYADIGPFLESVSTSSQKPRTSQNTPPIVHKIQTQQGQALLYISSLNINIRTANNKQK